MTSGFVFLFCHVMKIMVINSLCNNVQTSGLAAHNLFIVMSAYAYPVL